MNAADLTSAREPIIELRPGHSKWDYTHSIGNLKPDVIPEIWPGSQEEADPFLKDLSAFRGPIVWLNMHIDRLLEVAGRSFGLVHEGYSESPSWKVLCGGIEFAKDDPWINVVRLAEGSGGRILAEAVDETGRRFPYVVQAENLWYFADSPFAFAVEGGRFLILAELLHDILGRPHERSRRALVRIEDVNPESDPASLRRIADYLAR